MTDVHASLRIYGDDVDPLDVAKALGLPADYSHRRGEPRLVRNPRTMEVRAGAEHRNGMWIMSSERWIASERLGDHVRWILQQLRGREAALARLVSEGAAADVLCYSFSPAATPQEISETLLRSASDLGLSIDIDHYDSRE
jgi:hypothetical protein